MILLVYLGDHLYKQIINNYLVDMKREVHENFLRLLCQMDSMGVSIDIPITIHLCHQCHLQFHPCPCKILIQLIGSHLRSVLEIDQHLILLVILHNLLTLVCLVLSQAFRVKLNTCLQALAVHQRMSYPMWRPSFYGTHFQQIGSLWRPSAQVYLLGRCHPLHLIQLLLLSMLR